MGKTIYWAEVKQKKAYKTGTMYKSLRGKKDQVEWNEVLFNKYARSRAKFIL